MDHKQVIKLCRELGCCDACCVRYLGIKNPSAYANTNAYISKYLDTPSEDTADPQTLNTSNGTESTAEPQENNVVEKMNTEDSSENNGSSTALEKDEDLISPPAKKKKTEICISCLGILQEATWPATFKIVKEQLDKKGYDCEYFACALSSPIAALVREKAITLHLKGALPSYDLNCFTPLKEAWKWSFGVKLETYIGKSLTSGTSSPLLITIVMEYPDDMSETEIVKLLVPSIFKMRRDHRKRYGGEITRRSVEEALMETTLEALQRLDWNPAPSVNTTAHCASVSCTHVPHYLGGRYLKYSRELPQTPWLSKGKRIAETSVQETIFGPIAKLLNMAPNEVECRMKFMSAGREDVDVRCLGEGRPFAIEIADPRRLLTVEELQQACTEISSGEKLAVKSLVYVTKNDLSILKKGEESKNKTYDALCVKLSHSKDDMDTEGRPKVTERDIAKINEYRNTEDDNARIVLKQKTPIRVLHRRPLLVRTRKILKLEATLVPDHPHLFCVRLVTEAGTYVKEWVHGDLGRTSPTLGTIIGAQTDILALDVTAIDLPWPNAV